MRDKFVEPLLIGIVIGLLAGAFVISPLCGMKCTVDPFPHNTVVATDPVVTTGNPITSINDIPLAPVDNTVPPELLFDVGKIGTCTPTQITFAPTTYKSVQFNEPYRCLEIKTDQGVWHLVAEEEWNKLQAELDECREEGEAK